MPELPEVETVRRTLAPALGAVIAGVTTSGKPLRLGQAVPRAALRKLVGARITALRRLGKYLLVDTDRPTSVLVHLGMSGRFRVQAGAEPRAPHTHVVLALADGRELRFSDPRRFGQVDVLTRGAERAHPALARLGPDPIAEVLTGAHLHARARGRTTALKAFVLDQEIVAGVGNIYASEALWTVGLRPTRRAGSLSAPQAKRLAQAIHAVLTHALEHGGTSLRDFVDADGASGEHADYLQVYGRAGQPCPRCGRPIRRSVLGGRATFACAGCQK
ncbi:MAG: bifunctional DNA-formamidopyrimidine glycosylase/DNA-(apurinic or apyrimidinic site) lyase [Kofleriaceae bacterium]